MKRVVLAGLGALAMMTTMTTANAADLSRQPVMPAKAPAYVAPIYNWTGAYIGVNGGYGWGRSEWMSGGVSTGNFDVNGGVVGGTLGYNWQTGPWVVGLEGDIDWSSIRGSSGCGIGLSCETRNDWLGTFRGRLGYAMGSFLPYVTGGLAVGDVKKSVTGFDDTSDTQAGWTVGAGIEASLSGPWSAKVEYLYVDLGDSSTALGSDASFKTSVVRAGLNYKF
jgi:Opacity protein and related surface antigens